jgi:hypothetical protein
VREATFVYDAGSPDLSSGNVQGTNAKFRDTFFRSLFREETRALELYNAVTGESSTGAITLYEDDEFWARQNDLAFSVDDRLVVMCEHQSSWNPNMPLRMLLYFAQILRAQVVGDHRVYSRVQVSIPAPKFFVLYNGPTKLDRQTLHLSDAFRHKDGKPMLEMSVDVVDINWKAGNLVLARSPFLDGYAFLVAEIKKNMENGMSRDRAIGTAIATCINFGKLDGYLKEHYEEVVTMLTYEYSYETHMSVLREEARAEGFEEGRKEGQIEGAETVRAEYGQQLEAKDAELEAKDAALEDKDALIEAKDAELVFLRAQLDAMQKPDQS